jgi:hypothetical protein
VLGVALLQAAVDLGDLLFEVVDQLDRGGDVSSPGLRDLDSRKELSALDSEQVGDWAGACRS